LKELYLSSIKTTTGTKRRKTSKRKEVPKNPTDLIATVRRKVIHHTSVGEDPMPNAPNAINLDMKL